MNFLIVWQALMMRTTALRSGLSAYIPVRCPAGELRTTRFVPDEPVKSTHHHHIHFNSKHETPIVWQALMMRTTAPGFRRGRLYGRGCQRTSLYAALRASAMPMD